MSAQARRSKAIGVLGVGLGGLAPDWLNLPVPVKGEYISIRLAPVSETDQRPFLVLDGQRWAPAQPDESTTAVLDLPRSYDT